MVDKGEADAKKPKGDPHESILRFNYFFWSPTSRLRKISTFSDERAKTLNSRLPSSAAKTQLITGDTEATPP